MMRVAQLAQRAGGINLLHRATLVPIALTLISAFYGYVMANTTSPLYLIVAPAALAIGFLAFAKPEYAAAMLLAVTWGYLSESSIKSYGIPSATKALVALLSITLLVRRFTGRRTPLLSDSMTWWMLAYFVVAGMGMWYAPYPNQVMLRTIDFAKDILLYLIFINLIATQLAFERAIWFLLAVGAILGTLTVYQEITGNFHNDFGGLARVKVAQITDEIGGRPRAGGPIGDPNRYGQQLIFLIPLGFWAAMNGRTLPARLAGIYATVACLAGAGLTFSRATYLALAVVLALFALHVHLNRRFLLILPLLAVLPWIAPPELKARFGTLETLLPGGNSEGVYSEGSFKRRSVEMRMAVNMFADHPIIGVGAWNYSRLYPIYIQEDGSPVENEERAAHSFYLEIAAEHGLIGLTVMGAILILTGSRLRAAQRRFAEAGNHRMVELAVTLQIGFVGYLITATFLSLAGSRFLWLLVSLAVAFAAIARRSTIPSPVSENERHEQQTRRLPGMA